MGDRAKAPPLDRVGLALGDVEIDRLGVRILHPGGFQTRSMASGLSESKNNKDKVFKCTQLNTHTHN